MPDPKNSPPSRGYEVQDLEARPILIFTAIVLGAIVIAILLASGFYSSLNSRFLARDQAPSPLADPDTRPPEPRLQILPSLELEEARSIELERLDEYRWIDRSQGAVQIPIERAMELLLDRGLEVPPSTPPAEPEP